MKILAALVTLLTLSACGLYYRVPIVQGNVVTPDEVSKLKLGMTKRQVKYVLGTPLVDPSFEQNRWDYVFYYRNPNAHVRQSKLDLYFQNGKLADIEGNQEYTAQIMKTADNSTTNASGAP